MRRARLLACASLLAAHLAPVTIPRAEAQTPTLPPVTVTEPGTRPPEPPGWGGGDPGGWGMPECRMMAMFQPGMCGHQDGPPPPPKPPAQIEAEKRICNNSFTLQTTVADELWRAELNRCAQLASNYPGYAWDEFMKAFGYGCIERATRARDEKRFQLNVLHQQCLVKAEGP